MKKTALSLAILLAATSSYSQVIYQTKGIVPDDNSGTSGGGGSPTIGLPVIGAADNEFLYTNQNADLEQDSYATRDQSTLNYLTVIGGLTNAAGANSDMGNNHKFIADVPGDIGNSIALVFDGVSDVGTIVAAWNAANPSNTVTDTNGPSTDIIPAQTVKLYNGGTAGLYVNELGIGGGSNPYGFTGIMRSDSTNNITSAFGVISVPGDVSPYTNVQIMSTPTNQSLSFMGVDTTTGGTSYTSLVTDNSTYQAFLGLAPNAAELGYNNFGFITSNGGAAWTFDGGNSFNFLPASLPSDVGTVIQPSSLGGSYASLEFTNQIHDSSNQTVLDINNRYLNNNFGDPVATWTSGSPTPNITIGAVLGQGNKTTLAIEDDSSQIIGNVSSGFILQDASNGNQWFNVSPEFYTASMGDINSAYNKTTRGLNDFVQTITDQTDGVYSVTDSAGNPWLYINNASGSQYAVLGDENGVVGKAIWVVGNGSNSVVEGQVAKYNGSYSLQDENGAEYFYLAPLSGNVDFIVGDIQSQGNNTTFELNDATQQYTLNKLGGSGTGFVGVDNTGALSWQAGVATSPNLTSTYIGYGDSSNLLTGSSDLTWDPTGQTFTVGGTTGSWLLASATDEIVAMGDLSTGSNSTMFVVNDTNSTTYNSTQGSFYIQNTSGDQWFNVDVGSNKVQAGDVSNANNGTLLSVDDSNRDVTIVATTGYGGSGSSNSGFNVNDTAGHNWLELNPTVGAFRTGDLSATNNSTTFSVDDVGQAITEKAVHYNLNLVNYVNDAAAGAAGLVTGDLYQTAGVVMVKQ